MSKKEKGEKPRFPDKPWLPDPSIWRGTWREDWRIAGQEGYLMGKHLQHRRYDPALAREDFLQCEFCYSTFKRDGLPFATAYYEPDGKYWICAQCFQDFQKYFQWTVEEIDDNDGT